MQPGWHGTHFFNQAGLKLTEQSTSECQTQCIIYHTQQRLSRNATCMGFKTKLFVIPISPSTLVVPLEGERPVLHFHWNFSTKYLHTQPSKVTQTKSITHSTLYTLYYMIKKYICTAKLVTFFILPLMNLQKHTKKYFVDVLAQRYQKLKWEYSCKQELIKMKIQYDLEESISLKPYLNWYKRLQSNCQQGFI